MLTYCGQVQATRLPNGIVQFIFFTHPGGDIIAQIAVAVSDAVAMRDLIDKIMEPTSEAKPKH